MPEDLTPNSFKEISAKDKITIPDVEYALGGSGGMKLTSDSLTVGEGNTTFKITGEGIHLGAADFANAPFSVNLDGEVVADSLTVTGGIIKYGKTSFTDDTNSGYYVSSDGLYFGSVSDATVLKFDIGTGLMSYSGNLNDSLGNIVLDSSARTILKDFDFGTTDYAGAVKAGDITWNTTTGAITGGSGVVVYRDGIVGASAGTPTFTLDATTGDATFSGDITGSTITGGTLQTSASGKRVVIATNKLSAYDASDNATFEIDAESNARVAQISTPAADTRLGMLFDIDGTGKPLQIQVDNASNANDAFTIISSGTGSGLVLDMNSTTSVKAPLAMSNAGLGVDVTFSGGRPEMLISEIGASSAKNDIVVTRGQEFVCKTNGTPGIWVPPEMNGWTYRTAFDSLDGLITFTSGVGAALSYSATSGYLSMALGTEAGNEVRIQKQIANTNILSWSKPRYCRFELQFSSIDSNQNWGFGIGQPYVQDYGVPFINPTTGAYFVVVEDASSNWDLWAILGTGGANYAVSFIGTDYFTANTTYTFEILFLPELGGGDNGEALFYINGTLVKKLGVITQLSGNERYPLYINGINNDTNDKNVKVMYWDFWQGI